MFFVAIHLLLEHKNPKQTPSKSANTCNLRYSCSCNAWHTGQTLTRTYLCGAEKYFWIKIAITAIRSANVFAVFVQYFVQPSLQIFMAFAIGQIVDENDAMRWIVENATCVLVTYRAANIEQFDEIRLLSGGAFLVFVQFNLNRTTDCPSGSNQRLIIGNQMNE